MVLSLNIGMILLIIVIIVIIVLVIFAVRKWMIKRVVNDAIVDGVKTIDVDTIEDAVVDEIKQNIIDTPVVDEIKQKVTRPDIDIGDRIKREILNRKPPFTIHL
jgi:hypothetical protein